MASETTFKEGDYFKDVLSSCHSTFISDLDPVALLDELLSSGYIERNSYRDIIECQKTSDKIREILNLMMSKDIIAYRRFKKCLRKSKQDHLVETLEKKEKEVKQQRSGLSNVRRKQEKDKFPTPTTSSDSKNVPGIQKMEMTHEDNSYKQTDRQQNKIPLPDNKDLSQQPMSSISGSVQEISEKVQSLLKQKDLQSGVNQADAWGKDDHLPEPANLQESYPFQASESQDKIQGDDKNQESENGQSNSQPVTEVTHQEPYRFQASESPDKMQGNDKNQESEDGQSKSQPVTEVTKQEQYQFQASESPDEMQGNDKNQQSEHGQSSSQPVTEGTKQEQESSGSRRNVKAVEPSPIQYSPDAFKLLKQRLSPVKDKPRRKCTHEGRLLTLEPMIMETILQGCPKSITGGFGEVFFSEQKVPGLDIKVAVKKIEARSDMNHKLRSMTNEKLASRTMHFAIVPILASCSEKYEKTNTCYFLSPYLEKGDLFGLIKSDTAAMENNQSVELNKHTRMKIMYHLSSAVEFLHRKIPKLRGPIIHLDVKSRNIVLDQFFNARLTDFGVSREIAEDEEALQTSNTRMPGTDGYFQTSTTGELRKYFDYVNVGIVIRELLSGSPPILPENKYLKDIANIRVFKRKTMKIWTVQEVESFFELSYKCINEKSISAEYIVTEIEKSLRSAGTEKWNRADESLNCEMCIVNPSVEEKLISHERSCTCPLRVCVSCMRNEYLNPILCHSCGKGATIIDSADWGAILIAGIDEAKPACSKLWLKDIEDIRDVITSKFPIVIGMRKENVKVLSMIQPSLHATTGHMVQQIRGAFEELQKSSVHTLFIYFSGHYFEENGFLVGYGNEYLTKEDLKQMIEYFSEKEIKNKTVTSSVRFIVILDCCAAPGIASDSLNLNVNTCVVQLNACRPNEGAFAVKDGSIFKKFFVQGLTSKATKEPCYIQQLKSERIDMKDQTLCCKTCPIKGDDFVTIENLHSYIQDHLREFSEVNGPGCSLPVINIKNMKSEDAILGYLFDSDLSMQFVLRYVGKENDVSYEIPHQFNSDMSQLKTLLFFKYMEKIDEKKTLKAEDFKDICCIETELGPKTKHKKEVKTIEQLNAAWNAKRELIVSMRDVSMIQHGMVGSFIETENMRNYLFENYKPIKKPNLTVVILTREELDKVLENQYLRSHGEFFQKLETLSDYMYEPDTKLSGLHIIFPYTKDGSHRPDFVCFEPVYRSEDNQTQKELYD